MTCESAYRCDDCGEVCCLHCPDMPAFSQYMTIEKATGKQIIVKICSKCMLGFVDTIAAKARQRAADAKVQPPAPSTTQ